MTYFLWHGPHLSLIDTQCHQMTTHLWIQSLGKSKIMPYLQHIRANIAWKFESSFSHWVLIPTLAITLSFTTKFKRTQIILASSHIALLNSHLLFQNLCILAPLFRHDEKYGEKQKICAKTLKMNDSQFKTNTTWLLQSHLSSWLVSFLFQYGIN